MLNKRRKNSKLSMKGILNRNKQSQNNNYKMSNVLPKNNIKLKEGDSGEAVEHLQKKILDIIEFYPSIPTVNIDGIYGPKTATAIRKFQELMGIHESGMVDYITWNKLHLIHSKKHAMLENENRNNNGLDQSSNVISLGSKGQYVRELQEYINKVSNLYPSVPKVRIDGIFGINTEQAVIEFQKIFNLNPDGIVGEMTWNTLYNASLGKISPGNVNVKGYAD